MNIIQNAGVAEGLLAWRRLTQRYDLGAITRLAGLTLLLKWDVSNDAQAKVECFEDEVRRYEQRRKETISLNLKMGMALNGLRESVLRENLLLNCHGYKTWQEFKAAVTSYHRASGNKPVPMHIGACQAQGGESQCREDK